MSPILKIAPDGTVEVPTERDIAHLKHCLDGDAGTGTQKKAKVSRIRNSTFQMPAVPSSRVTIVECPACEFKGNSYEFSRHFAMLHGRNRKAKRISLLSRSVTGTAMKVCPLCKSEVRKTRLEKHMESKCPMRQRVSSQSSNTTALGNSRPTPKAHQTGTAGQAKHQTTKPRSAENTSSSVSTREKGQIEVERPSWWDNLDATKNCGYPAREEGRYGSYPSHDGFDDESKP